MNKNITEIKFENANSRDTYFTVHNIKKAHEISRGTGVKVGVIDWLFAFEDNKLLYAGSANITGDEFNLNIGSGHGLMMATTLKEIAPDCEIYAINATLYDDKGEVNRIGYFEEAIDWAIANCIDILTYSNAAFFDEERKRANKAIEKAVNSGLITTFIHNDSEFNIWPYGCLGFGNDQNFERIPDVNIYHFDYNNLFIPLYERYRKIIESNESVRSGNDLPYFSFSSMSVVLAGFVAILKSIKPTLTSMECKELLVNTSYEISRSGENWYDISTSKNVVDIGNAVLNLVNKV